MLPDILQQDESHCIIKTLSSETNNSIKLLLMLPLCNNYGN